MVFKFRLVGLIISHIRCIFQFAHHSGGAAVPYCQAHAKTIYYSQNFSHSHAHTGRRCGILPEKHYLGANRYGSEQQ